MAKKPSVKPKIDFEAIKAAAKNKLLEFCEQWLPNGRHDGHEYVAYNPHYQDENLGSFRINLITGVWKDFSLSDAYGGDAISLYAYVFNQTQIGAARALASALGLSNEELEMKVGKASPAQAKPQPVKKTKWVPIVPVPDDAPPPPKAHVVRGKPEMQWFYRDADKNLLGLIMRFRTSDGDKDIVPFTFCRHEETGKRTWRNVHFPIPRPLYGLDRLADKKKAVVFIPEGEKCADVAHDLLEEFAVVSWAGGGEAWHKNDWSPLRGRTVILMPDADAKREKRPKDVSKDVVMPFLPVDEQPGMRAMINIAQELRALNCKVSIVNTPPVGTLPDGWDIDDAVKKDKWDADKVRHYIKSNLITRRPVKPKEPEKIESPKFAPEEWKDDLLRDERNNIKPDRDNIILIISRHPDWQGVIALDMFAKKIVKRKPPPYPNGAVGEWDKIDDLRLCNWLFTQPNIRLSIKSETTANAAVHFVAFNNVFHPVKEYLDPLVWDGVPRIHRWLIDAAGAKDCEYINLAGKWNLIGMVARIYEPGIKNDTMLIFEGKQGKGKSTIFKRLAEPWFSDTSFDLKSKDAYIGLAGKWLIEIAELDSFNRAETMTVKNFVSSSTDTFRAPYDTIARDHPRHCVFGGTTNQKEYFKDPTGARRFWPVLVTKVDTDCVIENRDQWFAEALVYYRAGERFHPTEEEQDTIFTPEQNERQIPDLWLGQIRDWLKDQSTNEVKALTILVECLKFEISKISDRKSEASRIGYIMKALGWEKEREGGGNRDYVYIRPEHEIKARQQPKQDDDNSTKEQF